MCTLIELRPAVWYTTVGFNDLCSVIHFKEVMSEKTKEVAQLADATYAHTLVIKSTYIYR